jgi:anhydro-N-acetylmuramic acid kinase
MGNRRLIGIMSGTSLDGVDMVDVSFERTNKNWTFTIHHTHEFSFEKELFEALKKAKELPADDMTALSAKLGRFYGELVNAFMEKYAINKFVIDAVACHGQTVFHQPDKGYTLQIGNGPEGAVVSGLTWVCDFRTKDVALGGQGAPLVPIGDTLLFGEEADSFLNLGGFANVSYQKNKEVHAFDCCPANLVLNHFSQKMAAESYDRGGELGKRGVVDNALFQSLNNLPFYHEKPPKSLGVEWLEDNFYPLLVGVPDTNALTTVYHHIGHQIALVLNRVGAKSVFITGGGAKNDFLMECIRSRYSGNIVLPSSTIIDFKEAIVFAFLGALRLNRENNIWASYTGAKKDSSSGVIHYC